MIVRVLCIGFLALASLTYLFFSQHQERMVGGEERFDYIVNAKGFPEVSAEAWLVFDTDTGEILFSNREGEVLPIASITKLMTAEVALNSVDLGTSTTRISENAFKTEGRAGRLNVGDEIAARELLFPLLIESSNDAAEAISEFVGREAFIAEMNRRASEIGMSNTYFDDPSGLSERNVASSKDVMMLAMHLMYDHRHVFDITRLGKYIGENHTWINNNPVYDLNGYIGGKHGFTDEAGRTIVAVFEEQFGDNVRNIGIVLLDSEDLKGDVVSVRAHVSENVLYASVGK